MAPPAPSTTTAAASTATTVALIGNPNVGKSTLFNALAGVRQRVGNYPGVTVEKKTGRATIDGRPFEIIDLPGSYSLAPRSPDEMIAVDVLLGRRGDTPRPDVILCIVDASNLERNLYLVSQVLELGRPVVLALNMIDVADDKGIELDLDRLRRQLPLPIVPLAAHRGRGLAELRTALAAAAGAPAPAIESPFPEAFQAEVAALADEVDGATPRFLLERMLLDVGGYLDEHPLAGRHEQLRPRIAAARERLRAAGCPTPAIEAMARYAWVEQVLAGVVGRPRERRLTWSDRLDRWLTHRVLGLVVFVIVMAIMFQLVFFAAEPASVAIGYLQELIAAPIDAALTDGALKSLLLDGVLAGVGGVLEFLPQIFVLFFFIAVLEDCGYMARAAYLMDRLLSWVGLSGKSFIPLLSSFACAIPGIMATRVIENPRDRLTTMLVAPLMSCSARLPVYLLLVRAFVPDTSLLGPWLGPWLGLRALVVLSMYALGVAAAVLVALVLKRTMLRGPTPPFIMELPSYKFPSVAVVSYRMLDRGWAFVRRAGTLILAVAIVVWALAYFPRDPALVDSTLWAEQARLQAARDAAEEAEAPHDTDDEQLAELEDELAAVQSQINSAYLRHSYLGRMGQAIEPVVRPLGWDWRIGCAAIASFPAREVVIATLGVIFGLGDDVSEESPDLQTALQSATWEETGRPLFTLPTALSLMVFFSLCAQCAATLATLRRETNTWRWPAFTFFYMTGLAYVGALATFQFFSWWLGGSAAL